MWRLVNSNFGKVVFEEYSQIMKLRYATCPCNVELSAPCSLVITCWERAYLLALFCVMLSCVFVAFPYGIRVPDYTHS